MHCILKLKRAFRRNILYKCMAVSPCNYFKLKKTAERTLEKINIFISRWNTRYRKVDEKKTNKTTQRHWILWNTMNRYSSVPTILSNGLSDLSIFLPYFYVQYLYTFCVWPNCRGCVCIVKYILCSLILFNYRLLFSLFYK